MGKHNRLGDLAIEQLGRLPLHGKIIDTFDFDRCSELRYIDEMEAANGKASVALTLTSNDEAELKLLLKEVHSIRIPDVDPHLWLLELEIVDIRNRGLEGIRFHVTSSNGFSCYCESVECIGYQNRSG